MSPQESKQYRNVKVDYMARVEGEGALYLRIDKDKVEEVELRIFEPPRFFEAFLEGRRWTEAPDITARICGICPIAYQSSAISAMESIAGVTVTEPIRTLRRLMYCGEWIESHILHMAMLHAPDFLGYEDAIQMAQHHPDVVKNALRLKKLGNDIMTFLGGREIHPINMRVGGFYSVPEKRDLEHFKPELEWGLEATRELAHLLAGFDYPDFERDYEYVAMRHPEEYPMWQGRIVSNRGLDIDWPEFFDHIEERHMPQSTALHSVIKERGAYMVGPIARYNLNHDKLSSDARALAKEAGLGASCANPFQSILVRGIETFYAIEEALRLIDVYEKPDHAYVEAEPKAGTGYGCSEAPRGICFHRYSIDDDGIITGARIAPPTAQNQATMEEDLVELVPLFATNTDEELTWKCEQAVRNYDPCISCSVHFLKLHVDRC